MPDKRWREIEIYGKKEKDREKRGRRSGNGGQSCPLHNAAVMQGHVSELTKGQAPSLKCFCQQQHAYEATFNFVVIRQLHI